MAQSPSLAAESARASDSPHHELLQEATQDFREIDQVCHKTHSAETQQIERALSLLRKWGDAAEQRYGGDAMEYLRSKGFAVKLKNERRKVELSRVLNLRRDSTDDLAGRAEPTSPREAEAEAHRAGRAASGFTPVNKIVEAPAAGQAEKSPTSGNGSEHFRAYPTPISANHPQHQESNGETNGVRSPVDPAATAASHSGPRSADPRSQESPLFCQQCRKGPLDCMHSHRLVGKMVERGLEHSTEEEMEIALRTLTHIRDGTFPYQTEPSFNSSIAKEQIRSEEDVWIAQLRGYLSLLGGVGAAVPSHRKSKSLGTFIIDPLPRSRRSNEGQASSLPLNSPDIVASVAQQRRDDEEAAPHHSHAADTNGPAVNGDSHTATPNGQAMEGPTDSVQRVSSAEHASIPIKRRSREERQWCKVCKSNPYWCMHRQDIADLLPRSARFAGPNYGEGQYDTPMMDSPDTETFAAEAATKKRKRSGPTLKRVPPQLALRGDNYRDSGVGLTEDEDADATEDEEDADEAILELLRPKRRKVPAREREENLTSYLSSFSHDRIVRCLAAYCMEHSSAEPWIRMHLRQQRPRTQAGPVSTAAPVPGSTLNAPAAPAAPFATESARVESETVPKVPAPASNIEPPPAERTLAPGPTNTCRLCGLRFDANFARGACRYHPGELMRKVKSWGRETMIPIDSRDRSWWLSKDCPDYVTWTCCNSLGKAPGCQQGNHMAASPVPEPHSRVSEWVGARPVPAAAPHAPAEMLANRILPRLPRVVSGPAASTYNPAIPINQPNGMPMGPGPADNKLHPAPWASAQRRTPVELLDKPLRGHSNAQVADIDYQSLPDFCPPTDNLQGDPATVFTIESPYSNPLNLTNDVDQYLLHEAEMIMASKLRMSCASYLCSKRRIFQGVVEKLSKGKEYRKIHAQQACKIDARKARWLFSAFSQVGWFEPKHFRNYLPEPAYTPPQQKDTSDTDTLSSLGDEDPAMSPPRHSPNVGMNGIVSAAPGALGAGAHSSSPAQDAARRRTKTPAKRRWADSFAPTTDLTPDGERVTREVLQWRKKSDGRKEMTPTCPYPPTWAEADSIDRTMVRMKRRDKRAWPDIFAWWCNKGRTSLKNASCLAVRYSIMKRKFEPIWLQEEAEEEAAASLAAARGEAPPVPAYKAAELAERPPPARASVEHMLNGPERAPVKNIIISRKASDSLIAEEAAPAAPEAEGTAAVAPGKVESDSPTNVVGPSKDAVEGPEKDSVVAAPSKDLTAAAASNDIAAESSKDTTDAPTQDTVVVESEATATDAATNGVAATEPAKEAVEESTEEVSAAGPSKEAAAESEKATDGGSGDKTGTEPRETGPEPINTPATRVAAAKDGLEEQLTPTRLRAKAARKSAPSIATPVSKVGVEALADEARSERSPKSPRWAKAPRKQAC